MEALARTDIIVKWERRQQSPFDITLGQLEQCAAKKKNEKNPFQVATDRYIAKQHGWTWSLGLDGAMASSSSGTLCWTTSHSSAPRRLAQISSD